MKPISLRVKNLASYKREQFNFTDFEGLAAIIGVNGGGKSSFFVDAITIALFNRARCSNAQGTGLESMIYNGEDELEVEFTFESGNNIVTVTRRRFLKGGQELELIIDGVDHTDKIKETQAKLQSIIKLDYETFLDTICIGQGESGRFMKKAPNERKNVFAQVLNLDNYDVLQELTKEIKKEKNNEIKKLTEKIEELGSNIDKLDEYQDKISEGEKMVSSISFEIDIKEKELEDILKEKIKYEELMKHRNEIISRQKNVQSKVNSVQESISKGEKFKEHLENSIKEKDNVEQKLVKLEEEMENLQNKYTELKSEESSLESTNNFLREKASENKAKFIRLKEFNDAECEFCGQIISEKHKQSHLEQLMQEGKKNLSIINENKLKIEEIQSQIRETNSKIVSYRNEIQSLRSKKSEIEQAEIKLSNTISRLEELKDELVILNKELSEVNSIKVEDIDIKTFNDNELKIEIRRLREDLTSWESKIAVAQNEIEKIEKYKDKVIEIENEIKELKEEFALLDEIQVAFGKEGIQAVIIDKALPEIQDEINEFLGGLTDNRVSIEFITQKEKGKGKKISSIETLDIIVNDENGSRVYETFSGGEKFRVDFSCHVGLSKFLARRAGSNSNLFIVDEGIGSQDQDAKELFIQSVQKLTTIFDRVLVITHIEDIIESFPQKIEVTKDPIEGSKIRIVS